MKKYIWLICLVTAFLIVSCTPVERGSGSEELETPETPEPEKLEPIKIGFIASLTGDVAFVGLNNRAAVELAVKEINDEGGINGRPLEVIFEDGKCIPSAATTSAQKLVNVDKVPVIIGGLCSSETLAIAPIAEGKTVVISFGSSNPSVSNAGDYIFRDYPSDIFQGKYAAEYVYNDLEIKKVAILYILTDWSVGLRDKFKEEFTALGGEIVAEESAEQVSKDLRTQLTKIKNAGPELIYFPAYTDTSIMGLTQAKEMGITAQIFGADAWADSSIARKAGEAANGAIFVEVFVPDDPDFRARMEAFTGSDEVTLASPQAYDAVKIISEVMKQAGTNPEEIKNALYDVSYDGVSGHIEFDENGDIKEANYRLRQYMNGEIIDYLEE